MIRARVSSVHFSWFRWVAFGGLGLSLLFLSYFVLYVWGQQSYFSERNHRALASTASAVSQRLVDLEKVLQNAPKVAKRAGLPAATGEGPRGLIETHVENLTGVSFDDVDESWDQPEPLPRAQLRSRVLAEGGRLEFSTRPQSGEPRLCEDGPDRDGRSDCTVTLKARVDLQKWLGTLDPGSLFDGVLVVDGCGGILASEGRPELRLADARDLVMSFGPGSRADGNARRQIMGTDYLVYVAPVSVLVGEAQPAPDEALTTRICDSPGRPRDVASRAGGARPSDSSTPTPAPASGEPATQREMESTADARWYVVGLASYGRFQRDSMSIVGLPLVLFVLVFLLSALSWPFLKLWLLTPQERLDRGDIRFTLLCGLAAIGVTTIFGGYLQTRVSMSEEAARDLARVAGGIDEALRVELGELSGFLHRLAADPSLQVELSNLRRPGSDASPLRSPPTEELTVLGGLRHLIWIEEAGHQHVKLPLHPERYEKSKRGARTVALLETPSIPVSDRDYFRRPRDQRPNYLPDDTELEHAECGDPGLFIDVVRSRNRGRQVSMLGLDVRGCPEPSLWPTTEVEVVPRVLSTSVELRSLENVVLPPSVHFAILGENGSTLFSSENESSLSEPFLQEIDDPEALQNALDFPKLPTKEGVAWDTHYRGMDHQLHVRPLASVEDWGLVVYSDGSIQQSVEVEILAGSLVTFTLYMVLLALFLRLTPFSPLSDRAGWIWPRSGAGAMYGHALLLLLGLIAYGLLGFWHGSWLDQLAAVVATPVLALCALYVLFAPDGDRLHTFRWWLAMAVLGLCMGALVACIVQASAFRWAECAVLLLLLIYFVYRTGWQRLDPPHPGGEGHDGRELSRRDRCLYFANAVALWVVLAALPALGIFLDSRAHALDRVALARIEQFKDGLDQRIERGVERRLIEEDYWRESSRGESASGGQAPSPESRQLSRKAFQAAAARHALGEPMSGSGELLGVYPPEAIEIRYDTLDCEGQRLGEASELHAYEASFSAWPWGIPAVVSRLPQWGGFALRQLSPEEREAAHQPSRIDLRTIEADLQRAPSELVPRPSAYRMAEDPIACAGLAIVVGGLLLLVGLIIWSAMHRIFGIRWLWDATPTSQRLEWEALPEGNPAEHDGDAASQIILRPTAARRASWLGESSGCVYFDCSSRREAKGWYAEISDRIAATSGAPLSVVFDHFDHRIGDPEWDREKLDVLEHLVLHDRRRVLIGSEVDPSYAIGGRGHSHVSPARASGAKAGATGESGTAAFGSTDARSEEAGVDPRIATAESRLWLGRWSRVLGSMVRRYDPPPTGIDGLGDAANDRVLVAECAWDAQLHDVAREIRSTGRFEEWSQRQVIMKVHQRGRDRFRHLWELCSLEEQVLLVHLASGGVVNPHGWATARRLELRGLLVRDPSYRIAGLAFEQFVLDAMDPEMLSRLESEGGRHSWHAVRPPLLIGFGLAALFLFVTQRHFFDAALGAVAGLSASLPALLRLFTAIQGGRQLTRTSWEE